MPVSAKICAQGLRLDAQGDGKGFGGEVGFHRIDSINAGERPDLSIWILYIAPPPVSLKNFSGRFSPAASGFHHVNPKPVFVSLAHNLNLALINSHRLK